MRNTCIQRMPFFLFHRAGLTSRQRQRLLRARYRSLRTDKTAPKTPQATSPEMTPPSQITHILETCIYCKDLSKSVDFYSNILGLKKDFATERMCVYPLGSTTLLLFQLGQTGEDITLSSDGKMVVPKHGPEEHAIPPFLNGQSKLRQHYCLAVKDRTEAERWEEYFTEQKVPIIGRMAWERGGYSVYFEDPDGHCGEIASKGIWAHY